tara:strand:- start:139 stop:942 length:804 start_codon:yes stop_codon:yes gene_type:complete
MSNLTLIKKICYKYGIDSDDISEYISKLSYTPICWCTWKLSKRAQERVIQDIQLVNKIYTYDLYCYDVDLNQEYEYTGKISKHCKKVSILERTNISGDDLHNMYDIDGIEGGERYSYRYHNIVRKILNSKPKSIRIIDIDYEYISMNWSAIDIINHFRNIIPVHYTENQVDERLINQDTRFGKELLAQCNIDVIPRVLELRELNKQDYTSRVICDDSNDYYQDMIISDRLRVRNFWKECCKDNVKILWRPLHSVYNEECPTIELIYQ